LVFVYSRFSGGRGTRSWGGGERPLFLRHKETVSSVQQSETV
jgi:hypothetical protein